MKVRTLIAYSEMRKAPDFRPASETRQKPRVVAEDSTLRWYHVCSVEDETANGHPITQRFLELFVDDFYSRPEPGPVYRGHVDARGTPTGEEPPAAGWILALELTSDGKLWALYELTERLLQQIKAGEYRFNSIYGAVEVNEDGVEKDAEFISIAVTNRPAVPNLFPMAASRARRLLKKERSMKTDVEYIKQALKELGDDAKAEDVLAWVQATKQRDAIGSGESVEEPPAEGEAAAAMSDAPDPNAAKVTKTDPEPAGDEVKREEPGAGDAEAAAKEDLFALVSAAAAEAGSDVATALAALRDRMPEFVAWLGGTTASGTPSDETALSRKMMSATMSTLQKSVKSLTAEVETLRAEKEKRETKIKREEAEAEVEEIIRGGAVLDDDQRAAFVECALTNRPLFEKMTKSIPTRVPVKRVAADDGPSNPSGDVDMTPQNEAERLFLQRNRSPEHIKKKVLAEMRAPKN